MKMEQLSLPFNTKLEIGDRVQILSKSHGKLLPYGGWDYGYIGYVGSIESWFSGEKSYFLKISITDEFCMAGRFAFNDLRRI